MKRLRTKKFISIRDLLATAWPIIFISAIGFYVAYQFVKPAPPSHITISTGSEDGDFFAARYAELLAVKGITLEVKTSSGLQQNLDRLKEGDASIAFVQGGLLDSKSHETYKDELRSLGSVAYEPIWVFYRSPYRIDQLNRLDGKRIAVGTEGSSLRRLALQFLEANEVVMNSETLASLGGVDAAKALQEKKIDVAFISAAPESPVVQDLLRSPGVRVMSFNQADGYIRRFPFLSKVVLPRGSVDLAHDRPPRDTVLLATTTSVVVRDDLHPALASLVLQAMTTVHGNRRFFSHANEFPSYMDRSFELSDDAERYYSSGPPFLQRYLPFWIAVLVERLSVLILPIFVLLFPLLKVAPSIYVWRVRSKIFRCYGDLKFLENELRQSYDSSRHAEYLARLDRIEEDAYSRNIPLAFSDLLYTLREHVNLVRKKLIALKAGHEASQRP